MRESPRTRRLRSDLRALERLRSESSILEFTATGEPPEAYVVRFLGRGLWRCDGEVRLRETHEVGIRLCASYPRTMPELSWRTPIFHPNVSASGVVCLGGYGTHWAPSLNLDELCEMLWDMTRYENFDVDSPYNREAAEWARTQTAHRLPLDQRPIRDKLAGASAPLANRPPTDGLGLPPGEEGLFFLNDLSSSPVVDAELVEPEDPDILIIE